MGRNPMKSTLVVRWSLLPLRDLDELDLGVTFSEQSHGRAGLDRLDLPGVADEHDLGAGTLGVLDHAARLVLHVLIELPTKRRWERDVAILA